MVNNINSNFRKSKILFLLINNDEWKEEIKNKGFSADVLFEEHNILFRLMRRYFLKIKLPLTFLWFGKWKKKINEYDVVIIFASKLSKSAIKWIKNKNNNIRIIYWYWDIVNVHGELDDNESKMCEVWSFDYKDCLKYNFMHNSTFYLKNFVKNKENIKYDLMFVGVEKGRRELLKECYQLSKNLNLHSYFHIVADNKIRRMLKIKSKNYMSYKEVLKLISESKIILEILAKGQSGETLRTMESLFFQKKMITNNKDIINSNFYDAKNIFILGVDDINNLKEFVNSPYQNIDKNIIEYYEFDEWLKRFFTSYIDLKG